LRPVKVTERDSSKYDLPIFKDNLQLKFFQTEGIKEREREREREREKERKKEGRERERKKREFQRK